MIQNRLSVIVPVYNVENYLSRCIESILRQTFSDLELILIDDGSTDSSLQICEEYAERDHRITVIHQENAGVSAARNKGLNAASGQYITFVDSDDWLETTMYEQMLATVAKEKEPDVLMCDFINEKNGTTTLISANIRQGFYNKQQIVSELYPTLIATEDFGRIPIVSACNCIFKRVLVGEQKIFFDEKLKFSEDYLFMAEVITKAQSFYYLKENFLYHYRQYNESRSKKYNSAWWQNLLYLNRKLTELLQKNGDYNFAHQVKLQLLHSALFVISKISKHPALNMREKRKEIRAILQSPELSHGFKNLPLKNRSFSLRVVLYLIKHKLANTYLLYHRITSFLKGG